MCDHVYVIITQPWKKVVGWHAWFKAEKSNDVPGTVKTIKNSFYFITFDPTQKGKQDGFGSQGACLLLQALNRGQNIWLVVMCSPARTHWKQKADGSLVGTTKRWKISSRVAVIRSHETWWIFTCNDTAHIIKSFNLSLSLYIYILAY